MKLIIYIVISLVVFSVCGKNEENRRRGYTYEPIGQLPEIIVNDEPQFGGYQYPNPPLFDEVTNPPSLYGPPTLDLPKQNLTFQNDPPDFSNTYIPPINSLQPPQFDPLPAPLPDNDIVIPLPQPPTNQYLPPSNLYDTPSARLRISNMSCLDSPIRGNFRVTMTRQAGSFPLVIDDAPLDCVQRLGDVYRLNLEGDQMKRCGVRFCANGVNMCVGIRAPTVQGLKLPEDSLVTLQCRPQDRVAVHTKQLRMNIQNSVQGRSAPTVATATGGAQRNFESQVSLFRKSGAGEFSRTVEPGTAVQLGEDLLLRAVVREKDGWKYSRMGDVIVHHVSGTGQVQQRSVTLLDSSGCRDSRMRSVCPENPIQTAPLITTLKLRAFMFQGMASGDEMVLSVRMIACLQYEDCYNKVRPCDEKLTRTRAKRDTVPPSISNISNWQSYLEFRVVNINNNVTDTPSILETQKINTIKLPLVLISAFLILIISLVLLLIVYRMKKSKY